MKLFKIICGFTCVCFCIITANAFADARDILKQRSYIKAQERRQLINRVQDDINRLQDRFSQQQTMKEMEEVNNNYYPSFDNSKVIRIDVFKSDLSAKVMSLDKNKDNTTTVLQEKLSKFDMESKANELNIEFRRKQLDKENKG